jgi:hypothetical protein
MASTTRASGHAGVHAAVGPATVDTDGVIDVDSDVDLAGPGDHVLAVGAEGEDQRRDLAREHVEDLGIGRGQDREHRLGDTVPDPLQAPAVGEVEGVEAGVEHCAENLAIGIDLGIEDDTGGLDGEPGVAQAVGRTRGAATGERQAKLAAR